MTVANFTEQPLRLKLTVADFDLLEEAGTFRAYHHTELIDGEIVAMNAQYRPHLFAKSRLALRLGIALQALDSDLEAVTEGSVAMLPHDLPMPDIALTRAPIGDGPVPADTVMLVVEIADTTLALDTGHKAMLYARNAIPEYWVVDLNGRRIRQYWSPSNEAYAFEASVRFNDAIDSMTIVGLTISTDGLA